MAEVKEIISFAGKTLKTLVEIAEVGADLANISAIKKLGQSITKADLRDWRYRYTGSISLDDEHMFNRALTELAKNDAGAVTELMRRLKETLSAKLQDRYRLMLLGKHDLTKDEEAEKCLEHMVETMRLHAYMDDGSWENLKVILNLEDEKSAGKLKEITSKLGEAAREINTGIAEDVKRSGLRSGAESFRDRMKNAAENARQKRQNRQLPKTNN